MAKRKINAAMILAAGEDAHLQTKEKVSHAKAPYSFEGRAKKVKVEFDVSNLTDNKIKTIRNEIEEILKK